MDIQADINWIKAELDKVKDPDFVELLKGLLNYRSKKTEELNPILKEVLSRRALKSEEDIKAGRVFTLKEAEDRIRKHAQG